MNTASDSPTTTSPRPAAWRRWASLVGCFVLGAVFLVAAWAKTLHPASLADQITQEGLDFLLPAGAVALIALFLEHFLGSALVLGIRRRWVLWPTAALVAFFVFLTGRSYWRHLNGTLPEDASCGCFGNLVERTPTEAFWQDLLLMLPPLALAFLAFEVGRQPRVRIALVTVFTGAMMVLAWKAPELPLDDLATRLKPGVETAAICAGSAEDGSRTCLDGILPELGNGEHVVILADLTDEAFGGQVEALNDYYWSEEGPRLWVLSAATPEELFQFRFTQGPTFEIREAPKPLLKPLYRTLPRSFLARDGRVDATWAGMPPLDRLRSRPAAGD